MFVWLCGCCFCLWFCFQGDFRKQSLQFPVVDRPCLVLVRHCRKKKLGATDCVSGFPPFGQLFYGGLAGPRYLLEKNI